MSLCSLWCVFCCYCCQLLSRIRLWSHGLQYASLPCPAVSQEFAQTHGHRVSDAIQPSHPLSSPSPPAFSLSHHQVLFSESALHIRWPGYWSFSFSISPSSEYSGLISFRIGGFDLLAVQAPQFESISSLALSRLLVQLSHLHDYWKKT